MPPRAGSSSRRCRPGLDFELGAAIPTAYLTADITLNQIAAMKKGDRVLIHSGAGGVGMAAIALAQRVGAEIFATAGSPDKRAVLSAPRRAPRARFAHAVLRRRDPCASPAAPASTSCSTR